MSNLNKTLPTELYKEGTAKHKGLFFYMNRKKRLGLPPKMLTGKDKVKFEKSLRQAKMRARR